MLPLIFYFDPFTGVSSITTSRSKIEISEVHQKLMKQSKVTERTAGRVLNSFPVDLMVVEEHFVQQSASHYVDIQFQYNMSIDSLLLLL